MSKHFSLRKKELDPLEDTFKYRSLHFPFTLASIQENLRQGKKLRTNFDHLIIRFKRCHQDKLSEQVKNVDRSTQTGSELYTLFAEALKTAKFGSA